jgi:glycosyltransferase involved in cell wall biosynthesis
MWTASSGGAMIHFFPLFSKQAADTLYGEALRQTGVEARIFADRVRFNYRSRLRLLLVCLPHLAMVSVRQAWKSQVVSRPVPDIVVLGSDIEILIFAAFRAVLRRRTKIVHGSFIYTTRDNPRVEAWRRRYYRLVLWLSDIAIVHSRFEVERNRQIFPGLAVRFAFVPFGMNLDARVPLLADARAAPHKAGLPVIVAAGKSGRDYATLFAAMEGVAAELRVICDFAGVMPHIPAQARITVLDHCHGNDYLAELARADIVVLPLAVADISAGQMVMIQAKALGRPVVATDTPTLRDYAEPDVDAVLVPRGDVAALRAAIVALLADPDRRDALGHAASASYDRDHGTIGFMARMVEAISRAA